MRLISYARVSTDDKGQLPEMQLLAIRHYSLAYSHEIVKEFQDEGVTGDSAFFSRPNGQAIKAILARGDSQGIIVYSIDRFSRQDPFKVNEELETIRAAGWHLISVNEPFLNTDSEFRQIIQFMITWFANYFLKDLKRKVKSGMARAKEQGTKSGKPIGHPPLSQYLINKIGVYGAQGWSIRDIATELDVSVGAVHKVLKKVSPP